MSISRITRLLRQATSLDLEEGTVDTAVRRRLKQLGRDDLAAYAADVQLEPQELAHLVDQVVVPESWFFRDTDAFAAACGFIAERIARSGRPARILSVPCAGGEEPYSMAMALLEAGVGPERFSIDAADVSPQAIARAQRGVYSRNAFRTADTSFRDRHFSAHPQGFELGEHVRGLVRFQVASVMKLPPADEPYDIVFCRNLLIYFDEAAQREAIRRLRALLRDDGLLFSGYAETASFCLHDFILAPFARAFALRKRTEAPAATTEGRLKAGAVPARRPPKPLPVAVSTPAPGRPVSATAPAAPASVSPPAPAPDPKPRALLEEAVRLADQGATEEALAAFHAVLERMPDSAQAHFMLGLLNEHSRHDDEAREFLRRAVYLDPHHYEALCHLALLAERHGDDAGARAYRRRAARVYERRAEGNSP